MQLSYVWLDLFDLKYFVAKMVYVQKDTISSRHPWLYICPKGLSSGVATRGFWGADAPTFAMVVLEISLKSMRK